MVFRAWNKRNVYELCLPHRPDFHFYNYIGITNDNNESPSLGEYYYIDNVNHSKGERITYDQFIQYIVKKKPKNNKYLIQLLKKLKIC